MTPSTDSSIFVLLLGVQLFCCPPAAVDHQFCASWLPRCLLPRHTCVVSLPARYRPSHATAFHRSSHVSPVICLYQTSRITCCSLVIVSRTHKLRLSCPLSLSESSSCVSRVVKLGCHDIQPCFLRSSKLLEPWLYLSCHYPLCYY